MYSQLLACHQHCGDNAGCRCTVNSWHVINIVVTMLAVDVQSVLDMSSTLWWQCWLQMYSQLLACHQHCGDNAGCRCTVSSWHVINIVVTMLAVDVQSTLDMSSALPHPFILVSYFTLLIILQSNPSTYTK